ncbi:uncharacterized protein ACRADG_004925 isoform 1-T2 [Cochliomyia hominivorax]
MYRSTEQERNTENYRATERQCDSAAHSSRCSEDETYRATERQRNSVAHSSRRSDNIYRAMEQERNTIEHSLRRQDESYGETERKHDSVAHPSRPSDNIYYRAAERRAHVNRTTNPILRAAEQRRNTNSRRVSRFLTRLGMEMTNQMPICRVRLHRIDPINRSIQNERQARRNKETSQNHSLEIQLEILTADAHRHSIRMMSGPTKYVLLRQFGFQIK